MQQHTTQHGNRILPCIARVSRAISEGGGDFRQCVPVALFDNIPMLLIPVQLLACVIIHRMLAFW